MTRVRHVKKARTDGKGEREWERRERKGERKAEERERVAAIKVGRYGSERWRIGVRADDRAESKRGG
jgi:hypothetical protein